MKELKEKAQALIDKYSPALAAKGLKILLSKRYFESNVSERSSGYYASGSILNSIDRARNHKKEKENGYNYVKNRYHYFILTVYPMDKNLIRREDCREYAIAVKKIERPHIGLEPRKFQYHEKKILSIIEKRILKILKKAENQSVQKICQNNMMDAFRYAMHPKYEYKEKFLGKDRFAWEMIFLAVLCALVFGSLFIAWIISK
jgi:hypothetical protein